MRKMFVIYQDEFVVKLVIARLTGMVHSVPICFNPECHLGVISSTYRLHTTVVLPPLSFQGPLSEDRRAKYSWMVYRHLGPLRSSILRSNSRLSSGEVMTWGDPSACMRPKTIFSVSFL